MGTRPLGNRLQNYADRLALLDYVLSRRFPVSLTHLVKYAVLAEAKRLYPPLLPNLDHYGVHPVDVELALDLARSQDLLRQREATENDLAADRSRLGGQFTILPSPTFNPVAVARSANVSLPEFERNVEVLARVFPPRRLSDEERPGIYIPGRGQETLDPIRKALKDDPCWVYASSRWLSPKLKAYFRGVVPLRLPDGSGLPIPDIRLEPEAARSAATRRFERIMKNKEKIPRYALRVCEVNGGRHDQVEMLDSDVLFGVNVVNGPWPEDGDLCRCIVSESCLSEDPRYQITADFDKEGFRWKPEGLRCSKLLLCGRLTWDGRRFYVLVYGAISLGSLPSGPEPGFAGRQDTLPGYA